MKVSIVIPVYNPGPYIEPCIRSLLSQSMPAGEFEAIFVNDGSTDGTADRLDQLAEEHSHIRVLHQANSGWPGKPRNVGVDAANGDYIQFLDQDDSLGARALETLYDVGARNSADIVIGKVTSDFRGVPHAVFRYNVERCTIRDYPLIDSLTPHKMFRKAFLIKHDIAFPEAWRRLEDQLYMVRAYLAAEVVSIVGDYPCYFYVGRDDGNNAGSVPIEPASYFDYLRQVLDVILTQVEPGGFRDTLLRRFYRHQLLGRLSMPAVLEASESYQRELFDHVRRLASETFPASVVDGMDVLRRIQAVMLRENRLNDFNDFATRLHDVHCRATLTGISWRDGRLAIEVSASQWKAADSPLLVVKRDGRVLFDPAMVGGRVAEADTDVGTGLADAGADVVIRNRRTNVEWYVPAELTPRLVPRPEEGLEAYQLEFSGEADLDPLTLGGGRPLQRGTWEVSMRIHALGFANRGRLGASQFVNGRPVEPAILGSPPHATIPLFTEYGNLTIDIDEHVRWLAGEVAARTVIDAADADGAVTIDLPLQMSREAREWPARISVVEGGIDAGPSFTVPGTIGNHDGRGVLIADLMVERSTGPVNRLRPGCYDLFLHSGTRGLPPVGVGTLTLAKPSLARRHGKLARVVAWPVPSRLKRAIRRRRQH